MGLAGHYRVGLREGSRGGPGGRGYKEFGTADLRLVHEAFGFFFNKRNATTKFPIRQVLTKFRGRVIYRMTREAFRSKKEEKKQGAPVVGFTMEPWASTAPFSRDGDNDVITCMQGSSGLPQHPATSVVAQRVTQDTENRLGGEGDVSFKATNAPHLI
ncbi:hypothetical protein BGZ63DRAFT_131940 [Mariannaea sp. PMI_226]|nr:hypothetical protein BGZ63DRAFT_131940 [Mariannaea sp. PMI_226]